MNSRKKQTEIEFDPAELVRRVEGFAAHAKAKKPMSGVRTSSIHVPKPLKPLGPAEIRGIRSKLGVSREAFAALLNVPAQTASNWENGVRKPNGAALKLLQLVQKRPKLLLSA